MTDWRRAFAGSGSRTPQRVLDLIAATPFLSPRDTQNKLDISYNNVMRAIDSFEEGGVLVSVGDRRRDRVFCARAILDILEEPARLKRHLPRANQLPS